MNQVPINFKPHFEEEFTNVPPSTPQTESALYRQMFYDSRYQGYQAVLMPSTPDSFHKDSFSRDRQQ